MSERPKVNDLERAYAEAVTDRWEEHERTCLHAERLKDEGLPFHCILSLRAFIAETLAAAREATR